MILSIFLFLLALSIGLFIIGFNYKGDIKNGGQLFHIASGFLLLMCGLIILALGVQFPSGSLIVQNGSITTISDTYVTLQGFSGSYGLSILFIVLSFAIFLYSFFEWKYSKSNTVNSIGYEEEE